MVEVRNKNILKHMKIEILQYTYDVSIEIRLRVILTAELSYGGDKIPVRLETYQYLTVSSDETIDVVKQFEILIGKLETRLNEVVETVSKLEKAGREIGAEIDIVRLIQY